MENLRPRLRDADLVFGQLVHQALAQLFRTGADPAESFDNAWLVLANEPLQYGDRESWQVLRDKGAGLFRKFIAEEAPCISAVRAIEKAFNLTITRLGAPLIGVVDLVAELDGTLTVIDFKTAKAAYPEHEVALADQLTAYQLAEPEAEQVAFCVFVKTKEPRIDWYISARQPANLAEYLAKAGVVAHAIAAGRPGKWCGYCDYLPVCMGDQQKIQETLVQVAPRY